MTDREEFRDEVADANEVIVLDSAVVASALEKATIDQQITTAKAYPRSITEFQRELKSLATMNKETAESCFYALKRGGRVIEGPSVRFAELVMYAFPNVRAQTWISGIDETHITAEGMLFDLERNRAIKSMVKRRITDKYGKRYNEDMITVTGNAASAIAFRNAVFAGIPRALYGSILEQAKRASLGDGTIQQKQEQAARWFGNRGITEEQILGFLEVKGWPDVGEEELILLRGVRTAVEDKEADINDLFPREGSTPTTKAADLTSKIKDKKQAGAGSSSPPGDASIPSEETPPEEPAPRITAERKNCSMRGCPNDADEGKPFCGECAEKGPPSVRKGGKGQGELL